MATNVRQPFSAIGAPLLSYATRLSQLPIEIGPGFQGRDHLATDVGQPREIESRNLRLILEDQNGLEPQVVPMEVREHDRGQPRLVPVWHPVQEQGCVELALDPVVDAVRLGTRKCLGQVVRLHLLLVDQALQYLGEVVVKRRLDPGSGEQGQVVHARQRLAEAEYGFRKSLDGCVEAEGAALPFHSHFGHDPFEHLSSCSIQERVDIVLVTDVHEGVTAIRQAYATHPGLRHVDRKPVPVGELEVRAQHQCAVGARRQLHVRAQPLAQALLQRVHIKIHRATSARRAMRRVRQR